MPVRRREYGILGSVFILLTASTAAWTLANDVPPAWDPADHLRTAYDFYQRLAVGRIAGFLHEFFVAPHGYAPLFHLLTAGVFLIAGVSSLSGIVTNFLGLAIVLLSVNWIGAHYSDEAHHPAWLRPGAAAAILAVCYHFPAWLVHEAFLDYLLMAMVALAFALLLRADQFHVRSHAIQFGVIAGLGLLTKQTFLFFFILPAAVLAARACIRRDGPAIRNLLLAGATAALIASIWYVPHAKDIIDIYHINAMGALQDREPPIWSVRSLAYYWGVLLDLQIQLPFAVLFAAGAVYSLRRHFRRDWLLYLWILGGVLSFTWIANKDARYTVPILPAVALLSVSWLERLRPKRAALATAAIVLWAFVSFFNAQWSSGRRDARLNMDGIPLYVLAGDIVRFDHPPQAEDWSIPAIVQASAGKLGVAPNIWQLNPSNIALYASQHAPRLRILWLLDAAAPDRLDQCDFVLVRSHFEAAAPAEPIELAIATYLHRHSGRFRPVATFALPHGQQAVLFKRVPEV